MSSFIPLIDLEESSKILSQFIFEVLGIPPQIRLPRHPQFGAFKTGFILMSNEEAEEPNIPDGVVTGVLHFLQEKEKQDFFLRLRFDTKSGAVEIGNESDVYDVHRSITRQIEEQINGQTAKYLSSYTDKLAGHWHIAGAVSGLPTS
ncbi:MAG: hypothetical protein GYA55_13135 [SAR324 cluster bacterium]|uniref:Uncharacterized protein n=1 Tax=SAR324 cluster bacterium TaxID=2024889 RepID=A0A7X9FTL4_9DELT|nr:hypothetical protein [SAR324 cluster bacterium]